MDLRKKIEIIFETVFNSTEKSRATEKFNKFAKQVRETNLSENELFNVLWYEAIKKQYDGGMVYPCAYALYKLNIKCPLSPKDAIEMLLDWEVSIQEVPWYLTNQFSKETLIETISKLKNYKDPQRLETILYWANLVPGKV